jgi:hypothetical protein
MKILTGIAAALVLTLAFAVGPASAKQVYDYKYSGTFIDGTGSEAGQFTGGLGGLAYNKQTGELLVVRAGSPGKVTKFTKAGAPVKFSALNAGTGGDTISFRGYVYEGNEYGMEGTTGADLAVDDTAGPNAGNIYSMDGVSKRGWSPNGLELPSSCTSFECEPGGTENRFYSQYDSDCGISVGPNGEIWKSNGRAEGVGPIAEINVQGELIPGRAFLGLFGGVYHTCHTIVDSQGNFYAINNPQGFQVFPTKFPPEPVQQGIGPEDKEELYRLGGQGSGEMAIDRSDDSVFISSGFNPVTIQQWDSHGGRMGNAFGAPEVGYEGLQGPGGIAVDPVTHDVWVSNNRQYGGGVRHIEKFERVGPFTVPTTDTTGATRPEGPGKATIHGVLNPDGVATTSCVFKWGTNQETSNTIPCAEGNVHAGSSDIDVSATLTGLTKGTRYWYRLVANNANNRLSEGGPERFRAQNKPVIGVVFPDSVNTDGVRMNGNIDPNGGLTSYHWEYGPTEAYGFESPSKRLVRRDSQDLEQLPTSVVDPYAPSDLIVGLTPDSDYHFRLVAENEEGVTTSPDFEFTTYLPDPGTDPCPNSLVRQQTTSALLMDCRAYELASTSSGGGYDVVSDLVPGQEPLVTSPWAEDRLLYSMDSGVIPGIAGNPTNLGRDPYLATRDPDTGWSTRYVGLPADGMSDEGAYGSPLLEADNSLDTFAFGGTDICDPCFADGSINIPLRTPGGSLVKGMAGSLNPSANPVGEVRRRFSADGSHLIFGADQKFDEDGNNGSVSIYDRDLDAGTTQVVSTMPNGSTMTGTVAALDVSEDGSRILIGKKVDEDPQGNGYFDLYMHVGSSPNSIAVADTASGVIFNGMTEDGSKVFFSTPDPLSGDTDSSIDLYRADVGSSSATISRVSTGSGAGDTDACNPPGDPDSWNSADGPGQCNVLAFAGGAGMAEGDGTIYFLSPEKLDGNGDQDMANLFVAEPGQAPSFVATIDTSAGKPGPQPPEHPVAQTNFGAAFTVPNAVAVDQGNGDVYVANVGAKKVERFTSAGAAKEFTAGPGSGTNALPNLEWPEIAAAQVAIDNSGGPASGDIYVVHQNESFESFLSVYAPTGALLTTLNGSGTPGGAFGFACGVAVDQSNGDVYVGDYFGNIFRYSPAANPVVEANYSGGIGSGGFGSCQVAVAGGKVYARFEGGEVKRYATSSFLPGPPVTPASKQIVTGARGVGVDPETKNAYVTLGNKINVYDDDEAATLLESFGTGSLTNSSAVAVRASNKHVFASSNNNRVVEFGYVVPPYTPIDHHAIVNAAKQSETHDYGDFQVSSNGDYAVFDSALPLTGHLNFKHFEVYRYVPGTEELDCPSCAPTKAAATTDTFLPKFGLGLTEDGRVFFTTKESFVLRDSNGRRDAYEWRNGAIQLISRGLGAEDSGLLGVSADGVDAFFFTRDRLVHSDGNGNAVKVYDAREGGGFPFDPSTEQCKASDECHGPGTASPGPPDINSLSPAPTVIPAKQQGCKKGFVKKHGKCVKKKKRKKKKRKASRKHG